MATIQDVASKAGVSVKTVSRYLSGYSGISPRTVEKIERVTQELEFFPSAAARSLRGQSSGIISLITDNLTTTPFSFDIIKGIQSVCIKHNKLLLIGETQDKEVIFKQLVERFREQKVEAIIKASFFHKPITINQKFERCPLVLVNCFDESGKYPAVVPDDYQGAFDLTQRLIDLGHKRIFCINLPSDMVASQLRQQGHLDALEAAGIKPVQKYSAYSSRANAQETSAWLHNLLDENIAQTKKPPTAIMCANDKMAFQVMMHLSALGINVPTDISVVGYDDFTLISENTVPPLTTCALPYYDMGVRAAELAIKLTESAGKKLTPRTIKMACPPVIRFSDRAIK